MNLSQLIAAYDAQFPTTAEITLQFGRCTILVKTNAPALKQFLQEYFVEFRGDASATPEITVHALDMEPVLSDLNYTTKQPDTGKRKIKEQYLDIDGGRIVRKVLTGLVLAFGGKQNYALGPCLKNDAQVVNFVIHRYIEWLLRQEGLLLHAAGISCNGRGIALAGFSGMGKSTLALHLMGEETTFVSNDRAIVTESGNSGSLFGVPKMPRVNPGTILHNSALHPLLSDAELSRFKKMPAEELWPLEDKHDVLIHEIYGPGRFQLEANLAGLVLLNWSGDSDTPTRLSKISIAERTELLPAFTKSTGLFNDPAAGGGPALPPRGADRVRRPVAPGPWRGGSGGPPRRRRPAAPPDQRRLASSG